MKTSRDALRKNTEIELKLLFDPADETALRSHYLFSEYAKAVPRTETLESTYFDTPEMYLRRQNASLRVRKTGRGWRQTLKGGGEVNAGLHQHNEWENDIEGPSLHLQSLCELIEPSSDWRKILASPELTEHLGPIFTTRVTRTIWDLQEPAGTQIECAIDVGKIECENLSEPVSEIELELKSGDPRQLFRLALQLLETIPLHAGNLNKAARGYMLCLPPQAPVIVKAAPVVLSAAMTVEQAFAAIVSNCMNQIQANEIGVLHGTAPESVHQMRVGVRRLRSALRMFGKVISVPADTQDGLSWLASELGSARDWEVLADSTLTKVIDGNPDESGLSWLRTAANGVARGKREQVGASLRSSRYARLVLTIADWRLGTGWRDGLDAVRLQALEAPARAFADSALERDHKRLMKRGKRLHGIDAEERHKVRIAAKKLRYATEFFQSLYRQRRVKKYVKALSRLQDELGWLNDAVVAQSLLPDLKETHPALASDVDFTRGYLSCVTSGAGERLREPWDRFSHAKAPHGIKQ